MSKSAWLKANIASYIASKPRFGGVFPYRFLPLSSRAFMMFMCASNFAFGRELRVPVRIKSRWFLLPEDHFGFRDTSSRSRVPFDVRFDLRATRRAKRREGPRKSLLRQSRFAQRLFHVSALLNVGRIVRQIGGPEFCETGVVRIQATRRRKCRAGSG